jgi:hypothetical protein
MPILIAIGLKQRPENAEVEEFRAVFQELRSREASVWQARRSNPATESLGKKPQP